MVREMGPLHNNPSLQGTVDDNEQFFAPIFYLSAALGADAPHYLADLVAGDERFFLSSPEAGEQNYNYNDNTFLIEAIRKGYKGAFWDILRRIAEGEV